MTPDEHLKRLDAARWRVAGSLTLAMIAVYAGFILLIAYNKELLTATLVPGLSVGILLGASVILAAWLLIWIYVRWANLHYDTALARMERDEQ